MKCVAIFLLACVAVSQAAFTANLVEQVQPALNQALFKIRLAGRAGSSDVALVDHLQSQANSIISQIQTSVETAQAVSQQAVSALTATVQQLQALGQNSLQLAQGHLQGLFGNIWGQIFGANSRSLAGALNFAQNLDLGAVINGLFEQAQELVSSLNVPQLLQNAVDQVLSQLGLRSSLAGIVGQLQTAAQQAVANIQALAQQATIVAGNALNQVQLLAQNFVTQAQNQVQTTLSEYVSSLKPFQQSLGSIYDNVAAQVASIVGVKA